MSVVNALRLAETSNLVRVPKRKRAVATSTTRPLKGMEPRTLSYIAAVCNGELREGSPEGVVRSISTDSRRVASGDLFFALKGDRFDGHDFLKDVAAKGVAGIVAESSKVRGKQFGCETILVEDSRRALGQLATCFRTEFDLPVIAIAGSNGKTTTKDLAATILGQRFHVLSSPASFNNDIGVPLTLLNLNKSYEAAVLEVGTNHPGELAPLVRMIQPRYGVITSIGREHMEFFGSLDAVAQEQGDLAEMLPSYGKLFINGDTEHQTAIAKRCRGTVIRVGFGSQNDWRIKSCQLTRNGTAFEIKAPVSGFGGGYQLPLLGQHQALNALFAIGLAAEFGFNPEECRSALTKAQPSAHRMQLLQHNGIYILDDSYNANADSMVAGLKTLAELPCEGKRIAVLGDMGELGEHSDAAHREVGETVGRVGIDELIAVGKFAATTTKAAKQAGCKATKQFSAKAEAIGHLKSFLKSGDIVLVKASRAERFEEIVEAISTGAVANGVLP